MIETSVVGSYPISLTKDEFIRSFETHEDPYLHAVGEAVRDQISAGIDTVSTGQVRTDMVSEFTRRFAGIIERKNEKYAIHKIKFVEPVTLKDLLCAREFLPEGKKLKAVITGPFTLAKSCKITEDSGYKNLEEIAFDFAEALNQEAKSVEGIADVIQFDEPYFSQDFPGYGKDLISEVRKGLEKPVVLHVCGDVSEIFDKLTKYEVDILDHEFAANPNLLERIASVSFGQKIGYGCVSSHNKRIEDVDEIARNIEKAIEVFGEERIILDPDCGLRYLLREIAYQKISNMVEARNLVLGIKKIKARRERLERKDWDAKGYFYIFIDGLRKEIKVEHYTYEHVLLRVIHGRNAESILHTILKHGLTSDDLNGKRHFGYIATELQKAEIALENNLPYTQDKKIKLE